MPTPPAPNPSRLDAQQVLKHAFDDVTGRLRTDATLSGDVVIGDIEISQTDDSIRIGDGTNLVTATVDGGKTGLDVNVINDITLDIDAASGDNIAISDGTDTLAINADGSLNAQITNEVDVRNLTFATDKVDVSGSSVTVSATDLDTRDLTFATDKVDVSGSSVNVSATDLDIRNLSNLTDNVAIGNGANIAQVNSNSELLVKDTDLVDSLEAGVILSGTDDGTLTGTKYPLINNLRQQILAAEDRQQDIFYADFGTKNQRITQIDYTSAKIGAVIARKTISYTLVGTRYRRDSIDWSII